MVGKGTGRALVHVVGQLLDRSDEHPLLASVRPTAAPIDERQDREGVPRAAQLNTAPT
jgi:hypothetical protein